MALKEDIYPVVGVELESMRCSHTAKLYSSSTKSIRTTSSKSSKIKMGKKMGKKKIVKKLIIKKNKN
jgi:hypothetical protein